MTPLTREAREAYTKEMGPSRSHTSIVASTGQLSCSRHTHTHTPAGLSDFVLYTQFYYRTLLSTLFNARHSVFLSYGTCGRRYYNS